MFLKPHAAQDAKVWRFSSASKARDCLCPTQKCFPGAQVGEHLIDKILHQSPMTLIKCMIFESSELLSRDICTYYCESIIF